MESKHEYSMITSTCPDKESAKRIAGTLVEARLAACVQMIPIESVILNEASSNEHRIGLSC